MIGWGLIESIHVQPIIMEDQKSLRYAEVDRIIYSLCYIYVLPLNVEYIKVGVYMGPLGDYFVNSCIASNVFLI